MTKIDWAYHSVIVFASIDFKIFWQANRCRREHPENDAGSAWWRQRELRPPTQAAVRCRWSIAPGEISACCRHPVERTTCRVTSWNNPTHSDTIRYSAFTLATCCHCESTIRVIGRHMTDSRVRSLDTRVNTSWCRSPV